MSSAIRSLRFLPVSDSKDRQRYSDGEVFYDRQANTLRIYNGNLPGGFKLATEDYVDTAIDSIPTVDLTGYATLNSPTFTGTVSGVTAEMVGLGNVTNESKATMFTGPTFTGNTTATRIVLGGPNYGDYGQLQFRWNGSETDQAYIYNQNQSLVFWRDGTSYMSLSGSGLSVTGNLEVNGSVILNGTGLTPPLDFTASTLTTVPVAGSVEYDGATLFATENTTSGRGAIDVRQTFHLSTNGTAFGPEVGNFFGPNSAVSLEADTTYEISCMCFLIKTTDGSLTWAPTLSRVAPFIQGQRYSTPSSGIDTGGVVTSDSGSSSYTTAVFVNSAPFVSTNPLTSNAKHLFVFKILVRTGAACDFRMNVTGSAGTVTPLAGSHYVVSKISTTVGNFVA